METLKSLWYNTKYEMGKTSDKGKQIHLNA